MKDTNYKASLRFSASMGCFYISTVSVCFHFGTPNLRMSRHISLAELGKYFEKTNGKKKKEKRKPKNKHNQANSCFFLGDVKIEMFQEELRLRELTDLGGEKSIMFLFLGV